MPKPVHYLSRKEVAELLGVQPRTLSRYRLPEPDVTVGEVRGWSEATIRKWQKSKPGRGGSWPQAGGDTDHRVGSADDVVEGLVGLGFRRTEAEQAVAAVLAADPGVDTVTALKSALAMFDKRAA